VGQGCLKQDSERSRSRSRSRYAVGTVGALPPLNGKRRRYMTVV
jgi:hypothetical protein